MQLVIIVYASVLCIIDRDFSIRGTHREYNPKPSNNKPDVLNSIKADVLNNV